MTQLGTKKSRRGCTTCKRRRVKCNEQAPCANCTRRGEPCSLLGLSATKVKSTSPSLFSSEEWIQDLELMHHYDNEAALHPWSSRGDYRSLWTDKILKEACRHEFLMHGILALSALHIAHTRPIEAEKYIALCDKHQTKALEQFRSVLCSDITPEISTALLALSSTISILSMGRSCADANLMHTETRYVSMDQVAELFLLTRGVGDLIRTCSQWVSLAPMLEEPVVAHDSLHTPLPIDTQKQFFNLQVMLSSYCPPEYRGDCERALSCLEDVYHKIQSNSMNGEAVTAQIRRWMTLVPCEFITMIKGCFPPALVILAHFAAASLTCQNIWYTNDWGHYVLTGISMTLQSSELYSYLTWPLEQAQNRLMVLTPPPSQADSVLNDESSPPSMVGFQFDPALNLDPVIADVDLDFINF